METNCEPSTLPVQQVDRLQPAQVRSLILKQPYDLSAYAGHVPDVSGNRKDRGERIATWFKRLSRLKYLITLVPRALRFRI